VNDEGCTSVAERIQAGGERAATHGQGFRSAWRRWTAERLADLFLEACRQTAVQTLIECGAHGAETSVRFVGGGPQRTAIALEANPFTFKKKTEHVASEKLITLNEGVGAEVGTLVLRIPEKNGTKFRSSTMSSFLDKADGRPTTSVDVAVTTVDHVVERFGAVGPIALWIDVEGYGDQVLSGAEKALRSAVAVVLIEVTNAGRLWAGEVHASAVVDRLAASGLELVAMDWCPADDDTYNMLFVRSSRPLLPGTVDAYVRIATRPVSSPLRSTSFRMQETVRNSLGLTRRRGRKRLKRIARAAARIRRGGSLDPRSAARI